MDKKQVPEKILALRKLMKKEELDGFVVTDNLDQFYLGGFYFYPHEAVFLITQTDVFCFTRALYLHDVAARAPFMTTQADEDRLNTAVAKAKALNLRRVGFDAAKEGYASGKVLAQNGFTECASFISKLREVKDAQEIQIIRDACRIAYQAYEYVKPLIKTGMTELDVAAELEKYMRTHGATTTSFFTIVGFGPDTANPHHVTGARKLEAEDAILMDFGCVYNGYCSDITRSWWHGSNEPAEYKTIWHAVDEARKAGIQAIRPGVATRAVDNAARVIINAAGYGEYFNHGTGHGMGMENHETPYNSQESNEVLAEGNIVTVEPGIYLPGKYGVRLEDSLCVASTGGEILTKK